MFLRFGWKPSDEFSDTFEVELMGPRHCEQVISRRVRSLRGLLMCNDRVESWKSAFNEASTPSFFSCTVIRWLEIMMQLSVFNQHFVISFGAVVCNTRTSISIHKSCCCVLNQPPLEGLGLKAARPADKSSWRTSAPSLKSSLKFSMWMRAPDRQYCAG